MTTGRVVSWTLYLRVFAVLCLLTVLTVAAAERDFGPFNTLIAVAIATTKAALVVLYFMRLGRSGHLTTLVFSLGLVWLAILILFTLNDYLSRDWPIGG